MFGFRRRHAICFTKGASDDIAIFVFQLRSWSSIIRGYQHAIKHPCQLPNESPHRHVKIMTCCDGDRFGPTCTTLTKH